MASALRQLLDEISWEGNATKYRGGGLGKENVLTTEVFQALDFLPREYFLGPVLDDAEGAASNQRELSSHVEDMAVSILPGDLALEEGVIRVQPDVLMSTNEDLILVEAKAIGRATFQTEQLAREALIAHRHAAGRRAVVLLVLDTPPPIAVRGHGRLSITEAMEVGIHGIAGRLPTVPVADVEVRWTTWTDIATRTEQSLASFTNPNPSVMASVQRMSRTISAAIRAHS